MRFRDKQPRFSGAMVRKLARIEGKYIPLRRHEGKIGEWRPRANFETGKHDLVFVEREPRLIELDGIHYWDAGRGIRKIQALGGTHA